MESIDCLPYTFFIGIKLKQHQFFKVQIMKHIKQILFIFIISVGFILGPVNAGDHKDKKGDGFRKAAKNYDKQAEAAKKAGKADLAKLYSKQAKIKRANAKLTDNGEKVDWKEYYKNDKQIKILVGHKDKKEEKKKEVKPGDAFRKAAVDYDKKAKEADEAGNNDLAKLYKRQAEIKRSAAKLGDAGKWKKIDWKEYKENDTKIHGHHKNKKKH